MKEKLKQEKESLLKRISEIDSELQKPQRTPEQFFIEIINIITSIKKDVENYPDSTFFLAGEKIIFEIEKSILWCRYENFWSVFYSEFSYNYSQTQRFIKSQVEEHFKMKGLTPKDADKIRAKEVEENFKINQWENAFLHPNWRLKTINNK